MSVLNKKDMNMLPLEPYPGAVPEVPRTLDAIISDRQIYSARTVEMNGTHLLVVTIFNIAAGMVQARVFVDREGRRFFMQRMKVLTDGRGELDWSDCMVDKVAERYGWQDSSREYKFWLHVIAADVHADNCIRDYFFEDAKTGIIKYDDDTHAIEVLYRFQIMIRSKNCMRRHETERKKADELMAQLSPLPKDVDRWINNVPMRRSRYIYYRRRTKKISDGYCTACRTNIQVQKAAHNETGTCPNCHSKITFKAIGKSTRVSDKADCFVAQRVSEGIVLRRIHIHRSFSNYNGSDYRNPRQFVGETERYLIDFHGHISFYEWTSRYSSTLGEYLETNWYRANEDPAEGHNEFLYTANLSRVLHDTPWKYSCIGEYARNAEGFSPVHYLLNFTKFPCIEYLVKLGLYRLVDSWAQGMYYGHGADDLNYYGKNFTEVLGGCGKSDLPLLRAFNVNRDELRLVNGLRGRGYTATPEIMRWCRKYLPKDAALLALVLWFVTPARAIRYLERQALTKADPDFTATVLRTWNDYISMAKRIGYDIKSDAVLFPKDVNKAHEEVLKLAEAEKNRNYENWIGGRVKEIMETLGFKTKEFFIIAPMSATQIVAEGQALHHCVGRAGYIERHAKGDTTILFLRRTDAPDVPFYTMEVSGMRLVQIRGKSNCDPTPKVKDFVDAFTRAKLSGRKGRKKQPADIPA